MLLLFAASLVLEFSGSCLIRFHPRWTGLSLRFDPVVSERQATPPFARHAPLLVSIAFPLCLQSGLVDHKRHDYRRYEQIFRCRSCFPVDWFCPCFAFHDTQESWFCRNIALLCLQLSESEEHIILIFTPNALLPTVHRLRRACSRIDSRLVCAVVYGRSSTTAAHYSAYYVAPSEPYY